MEIVGRRAAILEPLKHDVLMPLVVGLSDQLSAYQDCRAGVRLSLRDVTVREGADSVHLLLGLRDRGGPLRLSDVMRMWLPRLESSSPQDFVDMHNARRWRFVERHRRWLERLFTQLTDALVTYRARQPEGRAVGRPGVMRFLEGVDSTYLAIELDDRRELLSQDQPNRWAV